MRTGPRQHVQPWTLRAEPVAAMSAPALVGLEERRRAVLGVRARRVAFGASLIVGHGVLVFRSLSADVLEHRMQPSSWEIVCITWLVAFVSAVFAAPLMRMLAPPPPTMGRDDDSLLASLVLPAAGLALFLPTSLHMPIVLAVAGPDVFDMWCTRSMGLVAHAHVVLAVLAAHRAASAVNRGEGAQLCQGADPSDGMWRSMEEPLGSPVAVYVVTILVSAVPFGVAYVMPPLLAALTGLPVLALASQAPRAVAWEARLLAPPRQAMG